MTIWTMIAAAGMLMWAICLALAMGPIWARSGQKLSHARNRYPERQTSGAHSWLA